MNSIHPINVFEEIARLRERAEFRHKGHVAETIVKEHDLRAVLVVLPAGAGLHPHQPEESVVVHVLEGLVRLGLSAETVLAPAGTVLPLIDGAALHDVEAERDSAILLILPWPTRKATASASDAHVVSESDIDEALLESMPASDPPAWTPTHAGPPRRDASAAGPSAIANHS